MTLQFVKGLNIFNSRCNILVNTVNCVGVMGAGLARQFKERYPEMFRHYRQAFRENELQLGRLHFWQDETVRIINFPTKQHWKHGSTYIGIEAGLQSLRKYLISIEEETSICIPPLGCGLGGLNWPAVKSLITECLEDLPVHIKCLVIEQ